MKELEKKGLEYFNSQIEEGNTNVLEMIGKLLWEQKQILEDNDNYQKENALLNDKIRDGIEIIEELNEQIEKMKAKISRVYGCMYCGCSNCTVDNCQVKME